MPLTLSTMPGKLIFSAPGIGLKITSIKLQPITIDKGICELFEGKIPGTYNWKITDNSGGKRNRAQSFSNGPGNSISVKYRSEKFTIVVKNASSSNTIQFIGQLDKVDDCNRLVALISELSKGPSNNNIWLNAKENLPTPNLNRQTIRTPLSSKNSEHTNLRDKRALGTPILDKSSERVPLGDVSPIHGKSSISRNALFASPTSGKKLVDDDVKIIASGGRKTGAFYGNRTGRVLKMNLSNARKSPVNPKRTLFGTFKARKDDSNSTNKALYNDNNNISTADAPSVVGFSNLGNTCYMNSILQCLLNIPSFFQDLNNQDNLDCVNRSSLYNSLCNLGILKYSYETLQNQRYALQRVKDAISSAADRFSGYAQHDAHEFLCQCLDQLKEDLSLEMKKKYEAQGLGWSSSDSEEHNYFVCPIKENYESTITHAITCQECNEQILKKEACHDFSLVIPDLDENFDPKDLNINDLLERYFMDEVIDYTCEKCKGTSSILSHQFSKLPRVLILHMKRYDMYDMKRSDRIVLPKSIGVDFLVKSDTFAPKMFNYDKEKFKAVGAEDVSATFAEKRKSTEPLPNEPLNKSLRQSEKLGFKNSFTQSSKMEGELLAQACRDSKRDEELRKLNCNEESFTKLKSSSNFNASTPLLTEKKVSNLISLENDDNEFEKSLTDFDTDEKIAKSFTNLNDPVNNIFEKSFTEVTDLTSVKDDEEEQFQQAIELSLKEFENNQREQYNSFTTHNVANGPEESYCDLPNENETAKEQEDQAGDILANDNLYKLVGVVNHHGQNTGTGHYTSDSYDFKSKKWRHYNDSTVKEVKEHEVRFGRKESAYIVFYMHVSCYDAITNKQ